VVALSQQHPHRQLASGKKTHKAQLARGLGKDQVEVISGLAGMIPWPESCNRLATHHLQ
jgi:hypothetical protein